MGFDVRREHELYKHVIDYKVDNTRKSFERHCHLDYEINFITSGDLTFYLEQDTYRIKSQTLLFIQPGHFHQIINNTSEIPYDRYVFRFNEHDISKDLNDALENIASVGEVSDEHFIELFLRLDPYISLIEESFRTDFLRSALTEIIIYLCSRKQNPPAERITNKEIALITTYIGSHLEEIETIEDICDNVFMSKAKVNRLFHEQLNTPPMTYVRGKKCILAKKHLLTGCPLTELAEKCGFHQYSTFFRAYRWFFGHSPSDDVPEQGAQ